ncbi:MAG: HEAT repeat domain-containing protein [candidate division WOR-3 bacterium]|nr:HEAT repeat domain-containing protein [candidate division WOR-3 bacterium]MCX7947262.1 HEAT repeat domain-containing protein [candidate division WOR-3 bacterium]MDW8150181.1 HEAT repeat domain-containing protein [candidate division WOR-3 bacterium]
MTILLISCTDSLMERLWKTASLWRAGENVKKVDIARDSLKKCPQVVAWLFNNKLGRRDRFSLRAIRDIFQDNYSRTIPYLKISLLSKDTLKVKDVLYLINEWKVKELGDILIQILIRYDDRPHILSSIIRAIGNSENKEYGKYLLSYIDSEYEMVRFRTIQALGKLKYYPSIPQIIPHLVDSLFTVRYISCFTLYQMKDSAYREIEKFIRTSDNQTFLYFANLSLSGSCLSTD